jgi:GH15 family glucan-1,4-alpha-glucosidase
MASTTPIEQVRAPLPAMALQPEIQDHALIGDLHTAALVAKDGSITFLCLPDFDSGSCFSSLLGTPEQGRWRIAPVAPVRSVRRRYRDHTLVLETDIETDHGTVRLVDFMPIREGAPRLVRIVEGISGSVTLRFELHPRFAYGLTVPYERSQDGLSAAIAGPDAMYVRGGPYGEAPPFDGEVTVTPGQRVKYEIAWARPYDDIPPPLDVDHALQKTEAFWRDWASHVRLPPTYQDVVIRSLLTLKACTYRPSGAIVAAPTFGLPETPGGERNWDYRFTWIRDSVLTLDSLMRAGLTAEAQAFGEWFIDAIGGAPGQFQIMYGIRGERILTENTLPWLSGYEASTPVRIGNGAYTQFQLDVLGELMSSIDAYSQTVGRIDDRTRVVLGSIAELVAQDWNKDDHGIWESRGPTRAFTASRCAAWVAIDRWIGLIDRFNLDEDRARWDGLRETIRADILSKGFDAKRNTFTQYYGSDNVDASLLALVLSGFLLPTDPRIVGTVKAIEDELVEDGLVLRYRTDASNDGLSGKEGVFLACSCWLADTYQMMGRTDDARRLFERVIALANDVGLLAEEYLPGAKKQTGNFPQAFSHLAVIRTAYRLGGDVGRMI